MVQYSWRRLFYHITFVIYLYYIKVWGRRDRIVVGFSTTCAISAYHHLRCEFEPRSWRGVLDTTLCDKVCQWLVTGRWISLGTTDSSTNKNDRHDITEILLKVTLNTMNRTYIKVYKTCHFNIIYYIQNLPYKYDLSSYNYRLQDNTNKWMLLSQWVSQSRIVPSHNNNNNNSYNYYSPYTNKLHRHQLLLVLL